ncbi:hypothetical protein, partial [Neisseria sicca]|uniref:hypothetical protein n=1 Tax=Neisseria sicca TaxID=490 RepID=UPI003F68A561
MGKLLVGAVWGGLEVGGGRKGFGEGLGGEVLEAVEAWGESVLGEGKSEEWFEGVVGKGVA